MNRGSDQVVTRLRPSWASAGAGGGFGAEAAAEEAEVCAAFGCSGADDPACVTPGEDEARPVDGVRDGDVVRPGAGVGVGFELAVEPVLEVALGSAEPEGAAGVDIGLAEDDGVAAGLAEAGSGASEPAPSTSPSMTSCRTR